METIHLPILPTFALIKNRIIMKHAAFLFSVLSLIISCGQPKTAQTVTKDQLTFPLGSQLPSPPFTGEAYIQPMIQLDDVFNFPTTNNITFAPGVMPSHHNPEIVKWFMSMLPKK